MTHTVLLSKVIGLFAIFVGAALVLKRRTLGELIVTFGSNRTLRVLFSAIELLAGLFLVMLHDEWRSAPASGVVAIAIGLYLAAYGFGAA